MLLEKLKNQEELYKQVILYIGCYMCIVALRMINMSFLMCIVLQKLQNLEADNKNKADFITKLMQDKSNQKRSAYQPLDEAFRQNKITNKRKLFNANSNSKDRIFLPCVTEDGILDD